MYTKGLSYITLFTPCHSKSEYKKLSHSLLDGVISNLWCAAISIIPT